MKYYIDDYDGSPEDSYTVPKCVWGKDHLEYVAEEAAEDYHRNHDGWESEWPLVFVILDDDLTELGRFSVSREAVPQFHATKEPTP